MSGDAVEIADAVAVGVGEAAWIDLIDNRAFPPIGIVAGGVGGGLGANGGKQHSRDRASRGKARASKRDEHGSLHTIYLRSSMVPSSASFAFCTRAASANTR